MHGGAQCLQALGCLLYYLAYGKLAFVGEAKLQVLNGDFTLPPRPQRPQPMKDLIRLMLTVQPADRPDIDTVLSSLGSMATNLKLDTSTAPSTAVPSPGGTVRPTPPVPTPQAPQASLPVSSNPQDLISTPVSASGKAVQPKQRWSYLLLVCIQDRASALDSVHTLGLREMQLCLLGVPHAVRWPNWSHGYACIHCFSVLFSCVW